MDINDALSKYGSSNTYLGALMNLGMAKGDLAREDQGDAEENKFNISAMAQEQDSANRNLRAQEANAKGDTDYAALTMAKELHPMQMEKMKSEADYYKARAAMQTPEARALIKAQADNGDFNMMKMQIDLLKEKAKLMTGMQQKEILEEISDYQHRINKAPKGTYSTRGSSSYSGPALGYDPSNVEAMF
jgi:hypothetical protein